MELGSIRTVVGMRDLDPQRLLLAEQDLAQERGLLLIEVDLHVARGCIARSSAPSGRHRHGVLGTLDEQSRTVILEALAIAFASLVVLSMVGRALRRAM